MTSNDFIESLEKLVDEYETANDNCIIGCFILFPSKILYQWNGERMVEEPDFDMELVKKEVIINEKSINDFNHIASVDN